MRSRANNLAAIVDEDSAHVWVWRGETNAGASQLQRTLHVARIYFVHERSATNLLANLVIDCQQLVASSH
jgi:hypothetical protein